MRRLRRDLSKMIKKFKKELQQKGEVYLRIKVHPGASNTQFKGILEDKNGGIIKIDIAKAAERGRANRELTEFLAEEFTVNKNNVKIINGPKSRIKLVKIH